MDRHISGGTKTDMMNQLTVFRSSPPKKMKVDPQLMKQDTDSHVTEAQNCMTSLTHMMTGAGSWFPAISTEYGVETPGQYQAVYPGMVPQYQRSELQQVMKIGECSIKPLGQ